MAVPPGRLQLIDMNSDSMAGLLHLYDDLYEWMITIACMDIESREDAREIIFGAFVEYWLSASKKLTVDYIKTSLFTGIRRNAQNWRGASVRERQGHWTGKITSALSSQDLDRERILALFKEAAATESLPANIQKRILIGYYIGGHSEKKIAVSLHLEPAYISTCRNYSIKLLGLIKSYCQV